MPFLSSLCLLYPISMPFLCLSLSHHYAFPIIAIPSLCLSYHLYAFSIPSLCLSYAYLYPITMPFLCLLYPITMPMPIIAMPSLSHHYAFPIIAMPSLSDHYAYAYHRYAYLSLRRHLNHFRVLSTCEGLWGFFFCPGLD